MAKIVMDDQALDATLIDMCGSDKLILRAAKESTGKNPRDAEALMERLVEKRHGTPFEMVTFVFELTAPVGIMTQLLRHRAFSAVQASTRYGNVSYDCLSTGIGKLDTMVLETLNEIESMEVGGRTRELLHMALPRGLITSAIVSINLRGLANFFRQRLDNHAQYEIRVLADMMLEEVEFERRVPMAINALKKRDWVL